MPNDTKKVKEAREALADALKEQEEKRKGNREKREAKVLGKCYEVTNIYNKNSKTYLYVKDRSTRYKRNSYFDVETILINPRQINISKRVYDVLSIEKMAKTEIPYETYIRYKQNVEVAIDAVCTNKSIIL